MWSDAAGSAAIATYRTDSAMNGSLLWEIKWRTSFGSKRSNRPSRMLCSGRAWTVFGATSSMAATSLSVSKACVCIFVLADLARSIAVDIDTSEISSNSHWTRTSCRKRGLLCTVQEILNHAVGLASRYPEERHQPVTGGRARDASTKQLAGIVHLLGMRHPSDAVRNAYSADQLFKLGACGL